MKNKKLIIIGSITLFLLLLGGGFTYYILSAPEVTIIKDNFIFEYGTKIDIDEDDILTVDNKKVKESIKLDISSITNEEEKEYPKAKKYNINLSYTIRRKTTNKKITVEVQDTIAPVFDKFKDKYEVQQGTKIDYKKEYEATDLSKVEITIDDSLVKYDTIGTYKINIIATDEHGNKTEKEGEVKIIAKKVTTTYTCASNVKSPTYVNGILIVNKKHPLPCGYAPGVNSTAKTAIDKLISDMRNQGFDIATTYSGYRSFTTQSSLYQRYVREDGQKEADRSSARPGHSEHQTGLAFDLRHKRGTLITASKEVNWVAANAHKYGFIVRYQQGKESITGYMYEPWHLRYIGIEAETIYNSKLTLEEYLGVPGGGYN